jgi:hypothetical protein
LGLVIIVKLAMPVDVISYVQFEDKIKEYSYIMPNVEIPRLPPVKVLATGQAIVASAEKGQISSITVEIGKPGGKSHRTVEVYADKEFAQGLHPSQAAVLMNLAIGGLGSGRGDRPTAFAAWSIEVADQFGEAPFYKSLSKYTLVVDYNNRGGTMVYPFTDLLDVCRIRTRNTEISQQRYPPDRKPIVRQPKKPKTVDVSLTL